MLKDSGGTEGTLHLPTLCSDLGLGRRPNPRFRRAAGTDIPMRVHQQWYLLWTDHAMS